MGAVTMIEDIEATLGKEELWRRQCARNLMDCYALGMEALADGWKTGQRQSSVFETLVRLMVDGITSIKDAEDEKVFYKSAAALCKTCAEQGGLRSSSFRVYAAIFEELSGKEGSHES